MINDSYSSLATLVSSGGVAQAPQLAFTDVKKLKSFNGNAIDPTPMPPKYSDHMSHHFTLSFLPRSPAYTSAPDICRSSIALASSAEHKTTKP
jgi:hypothetical protein